VSFAAMNPNLLLARLHIV